MCIRDRFYTSGWDGLPTILIELGALGMPIAASAVGGVPELITEKTGWLIDEDATPADAARILRDMIENPDLRLARATELQKLVRKRHAFQTYSQALAQI